jgi:hypothetical protein
LPLLVAKKLALKLILEVFKSKLSSTKKPIHSDKNKVGQNPMIVELQIVLN